MSLKTDISRAIGAIRAQRELVATRNGLRADVVDSWLAAVEEKCGQAVIDEPAVRLCLRVLERWVSPLGELASAHAALVRVISANPDPRRGGQPPR